MKSTLFAISVVIATSCAEAKFSATETKSAAAPASADQAPEPAPVVLDPPATCEGAAIVKNSFPPQINECYESGRVWNFGSKACVQMQAASFECKWDVVQAELKAIGLSSPAMDEAAKSGMGKLVGCGQSKDKKRIVVQWVKTKAAGECKSVTIGDVVTGCFTNYGTGPSPEPAKNKDEQDARVYACISEL